jgi:hypothetical protein
MLVEEYEEQAANCDNLCIIGGESADSEMPCVTCPFCKVVVTAQLTPTTIHCPSCHTTVKR